MISNICVYGFTNGCDGELPEGWDKCEKCIGRMLEMREQEQTRVRHQQWVPSDVLTMKGLPTQGNELPGHCCGVSVFAGAGLQEYMSFKINLDSQSDAETDVRLFLVDIASKYFSEDIAGNLTDPEKIAKILRGLDHKVELLVHYPQKGSFVGFSTIQNARVISFMSNGHWQTFTRVWGAWYCLDTTVDHFECIGDINALENKWSELVRKWNASPQSQVSVLAI